MEMFGRNVFIGCENGRIEVWNVLTGQLMYFSEKRQTGLICIKANNTRLVVGYLDGVLELYQSEPRNGLKMMSFSPSDNMNMLSFSLLQVIRAHRQPVTALEIDGYYVITGSLDHVIKVYSIECGRQLYI